MSEDSHDAVIIAGPDEHGIGEEVMALETPVRRIDDVVSTATLTAVDVDTAAYLVLTDAEEATGIPVAKELNPDLTVVTYTDASLPAFVAGVADLAVDPALIGPAVVADELVSATIGRDSLDVDGN